MTLQMTRPDAADMVLRTFTRSLHPELFLYEKQSVVAFAGNRARLRLGVGGHLLEFTTEAATITEVAAPKYELLPETQRLIERRLIGYRTHMIDLAGLRYHCSYQLESVPQDIYLQLHRELEMDVANATVALIVPGVGRRSPNSLSLLKCDVLPEGIVVHAYHTFPDNAAILRTQTLIELLDQQTLRP
ncbi:MAG: DUF2617 family protein [Planctomycetaceae bacterium]|nr:DUF2617 family protein [Planctomycetaceae bacterium]